MEVFMPLRRHATLMEEGTFTPCKVFSVLLSTVGPRISNLQEEEDEVTP